MKQDKWVSGEYRGAKKNPNDSDYVPSMFSFLPTTNVHQQIKAQTERTGRNVDQKRGRFYRRVKRKLSLMCLLDSLCY